MRAVRVTILYRNGTVLRARCRSFTVKQSPFDGSMTGLEWKDMQPEPLRIGVDDVAAVWTTVAWWDRLVRPFRRRA